MFVGIRSANAYRWLVVFLMFGVLVAGCSKKPAVATTPPEAATFDPARDAAPQPMDLPPKPEMQVVPPGLEKDAVLAQLTAELGRYVRYTHAPPKTFEEFASKDPISFPPPPAGKKYAIAAGQVILK